MKNRRDMITITWGFGEELFKSLTLISLIAAALCAIAGWYLAFIVVAALVPLSMVGVLVCDGMERQ